MGLILFFIIFYCFVKNPKDKRASDIAKLVFGGYVGLIMLSIVLGALGSTGGVFGIGFIALFIYLFILQKNKNQRKAQDEQMGESYRDIFDTTAREAEENAKEYYSQRATTSRKLPKSQKGRRKIVEDFNKKYNLYLKDDEIERIVNASYFSEMWKREVEDMDEKFPSIHYWFAGAHSWLRIYLYAFIPQEITSDFVQQEKIAIYSFDQVFNYVDTLGGIPMQEKIQRVNDKFYAQFDDITFMSAYRYLESKGIKHRLEVADPVRSSSPVDDLARKYEEAEG